MWKKLEYSNKEITRAGQKLVDPNATAAEIAESIKVIENWRVAHAFPMNTFAVNLRRQVSDIEGAIVAQRLKRFDTIRGKMARFPDMKLHRMQDIGGCRVVVPTIEDVYKVKERLEKSRIRHEAKTPKDYIKDPNPNTGYRGVHLIYKYKSDKNTDYNGLSVEIQIRTKLQHLWATAVETVGMLTDNGLKFNQGAQNWLDFFRMVSELFAIEEKTHPRWNDDAYILDLAKRILLLDDELAAMKKMNIISIAADRLWKNNKMKGSGYYLLVLDLDERKISITRYEGVQKGLDEATSAYNEIEQTKGNRRIDAVLVSAQSYDTITKAYPNYFADIREFGDTLLSIIEKHVNRILPAKKKRKPVGVK